MQIINPLQLNDWKIKRFLKIILAIQLALWGAIGLDCIGLQIPILRQFIAFIYLTFIPGIIILRILKLHKLGNIETLLYTVGLSIATLMFTGFFMNMFYPFFGIEDPLSLWPIVLTISGVVMLLSILAYIRDQNYSSTDHLNLHEILSPPVLALSLLPFSAVAGTYLMNFYGTNVILMVLLPVVALIPVVIACTKYIPEKYYPYAVFSVALTLLYHTALISMYVWGWDIQYEYYLTNTVIQNGFWDSAVYSNCNAMLSLTMLVPFYSIALDLGIDWIFKIIYPFLFAFVPLGLYAVFRQQTSEKIAFLACFFFMSLFVFYTEMLALARQEIAELFLVLILLSMVDRNLTRVQKSIFFFVFSMSLIVSHYGLSYLFMFVLFVAWALATLGHYFDVQNYADRIFTWIQSKLHHLSGLNLQKFAFHRNAVPLNFVLFYALFILIWYIYTSSSSSFNSIVTIAHHIITSISTELLNSDSAQGLAIIITKAATPLHEIGKYLQLLTIFFIVIGFVVSWLRHKKVRFALNYLLLAFGALCICIGGVALPYFASALNTSRMYQISLIFLAPFCVIGGMAIFSGFRNLFGHPGRSLQIISIFLGVFLVFNCGWVFEVAQDEPTSFALSSDPSSPYFNEIEVHSAQWIVNIADTKPIYADRHRGLLFKRYYGHSALGISSKIDDYDGGYIFLGIFNTKTRDLPSKQSAVLWSKNGLIDISSNLKRYNLIYTSDASQIYSL